MIERVREMLNNILEEIREELLERFDLEVDIISNTVCVREFNNYVYSDNNYDNVEDLAESIVEWIRYNFEDLDADYSILDNEEYDLVIELI